MISEALIEALIFANGEPIAPSEIAHVLGSDERTVEGLIGSIRDRYKHEQFGFELVRVAGKYQFRTKEAFAESVGKLKEEKPRRLSIPALETLSIIAYRQPVTRHDIEGIRGVDAIPTIKTLLDRDLVKIVGHKNTVGQPALFGTTDKFLEVFGLGSLSELPSLRELKEVEAEPGESGADELPAP